MKIEFNKDDLIEVVNHYLQRQTSNDIRERHCIDVEVVMTDTTSGKLVATLERKKEKEE